MPTADAAPPEPEPDSARSALRAGFVSRLGAFAADAVLVALSLRAGLWVLSAAGEAFRGFARHRNLAAIVVAAAPALVGVYNVLGWWLWGQTPGKWLLGIKVVPEDGGPMTVKRALGRYVGYLVSALPFYLGFLWILGPERRGWHDRIAGTEVVYLPRRSARVPKTGLETGLETGLTTDLNTGLLRRAVPKQITEANP